MNSAFNRKEFKKKNAKELNAMPIAEIIKNGYRICINDGRITGIEQPDKEKGSTAADQSNVEPDKKNKCCFLYCKAAGKEKSRCNIGYALTAVHIWILMKDATAKRKGQAVRLKLPTQKQQDAQ